MVSLISLSVQYIIDVLGDMVYFNVLGHHFLVLGSLQRTTDLFKKRSSNYSDRMHLPMLVELCVSDYFHPKLVKKKQFVAEWVGISTSAWCHTACGGESIGDHFMNIFTLTRSPSIYLFKHVRSILFCVDYLSHPTTSSTTFDSKSSSGLWLRQGTNKTIWKQVHLVLQLWTLFMELPFKSLTIRIFFSPKKSWIQVMKLRYRGPSG